MNKKRVLRIAFNHLGIGGIQSRIMVVTRLLKDDIDTDIVVFSSKPEFFDEEFQKYGRIFRCPHYEGANIICRKLDYYTRYFRMKKDILKILQENGPYDVVHSHTFFEAAPCLAAAKEAGVPIRIAHSHNTGVRHPKGNRVKLLINLAYQRIYRRIIVKNATHLIGCSQAAADYVFGKNKGRPIYNSVDCSRFNPALFSVEEHEDLRLIHVGNFNTQKNQLYLIDILKKLTEKMANVHLTMIGRDTDYQRLVEAKIRKEKLEDYVTILPDHSDVACEMAKADFFLFPSSFEGFGNVMLEAQSTGLHCFASTEVTPEVDCGLTTFIPLEAGPAAWAECIQKEYLENGTQKHPADVSRFTEEKFAQQFLDIYTGKAK